jgi:hypothetical protein
MVVGSHGALSPRLKTPRHSEAATARQLTFFARARSSRAAVALGEFFHATGRIHKFLFAGEKRMTSGADTDSNIATGRAGVIHRAARANDIGFVIFWMNACFHSLKMSAECNRAGSLRKR